MWHPEKGISYLWVMTIQLLAIGKTDSKEMQQLIGIYEQRLQHYTRFELEVIPDLKKTKNLDPATFREKEGEAILKKLKPTDVLVLLDERGKSYTSVGFSEFLQQQMNAGVKRLVFCIGGAYGFSDAVYAKARFKLSLSKMTFSHQMVRLFAAEQIYRAFTILRNEPYHNQ